MTTPLVTLPARKGPDSGLSQIKGRYRVRYYIEGKMTMKGLGTSDLEEARKLRDAFYLDMVEKGAVHIGDKDRVVGSDRYIYRQSPFFVKISGVHIGVFNTYEEAREARDKALGITEQDRKLDAIGEEDEFTI